MRSSSDRPASPSSRRTPAMRRHASSSSGMVASDASSAVGEGPHVVVEAGHGDPAVVVVEGGHQAGDEVGRVGHGPAEQARVQVDGRGAHVDVEGHQAPHAHAHRRDVGRPHVGVGDDDDVARQPLPLAHRAGPRSGGCRPPPRPRPGTSRSPAAGRRWPAGPAPPRSGRGPGPCRRWRPGPGTRRRRAPARTGASATRRAGRRAGRRGGRRRGRWARRGRRARRSP